MTANWLLESWHSRELIYFFALRDVKVRYKQAVLGAAWAILQPLLSMIVFTLLFGRLAKVPSDGVPYPFFAYVGLLLWIYFSGVLGQAGQSLVSNSNLLTKIYFPRVALPFSSALSGLLDLIVGLAFIPVLMVYYQVAPSWSMLLAPLFMVQLVILTAGAGLLISALNVWYRDIKYALPLLIQLLLFVTPVLYPLHYIPERFRPWMALNPLAGIVEGFRACMLPNHFPDPLLTAISFVLTAVIFVVGLAYFRRAERHFADVI